MNCGGTWPVFEKPRSENDVASGESSMNWKRDAARDYDELAGESELVIGKLQKTSLHVAFTTLPCRLGRD
jgi:hypothetical protein